MQGRREKARGPACRPFHGTGGYGCRLTAEADAATRQQGPEVYAAALGAELAYRPEPVRRCLPCLAAGPEDVSGG
jgi:hypothetical protein